MADESLSLESRIAHLEDQVKNLSDRVEQLSTLLTTSAALQPRTASSSSESFPVEGFVPSEEIVTWMGKSSLLPRISAACFILVIALILRTVTDNGLLNKELGSLFGMSYAAVLLGFSWFQYSRKNSLAPVIAIFGAVLMFSIVLETHTHFQSLPSVPAYLILLATGTAMATISYIFSVDLPIQVGTLGMCITGAALDFPNPVFLHLAILLLIANILGFLASRLRRCAWLRWTLLGITLTMLQIWVDKIEKISELQADPAKILTPGLFLPALAVLTLCFLAMALIGMIRTGAVRWSKFNFFLPAIFSLWAFSAANKYLNINGPENLFLLGMAGTLTAGVFLGISFSFTSKAADNPSLLNSFTLAAVLLFPISFPTLFSSSLPGLILLSLIAFGLVLASKKWQSGGVRAMSYLLQLFACADLVFLLCGSTLSYPPVTTLLISSAIAGIAANHYLWCRRSPPFLSGMDLFSRFDQKDRTAVLLFMAALAAGFYCVRTLLFLTFDPASSQEMTAVFLCAQSISINVFAAALMIFAFACRNVEWRNIAILITIIGAGKVFFSDLINTQGFPLVASVFIFGLAAALESVILSRWQRKNALEKETTSQ
jgi:hypothetical protein